MVGPHALNSRVKILQANKIGIYPVVTVGHLSSCSSYSQLRQLTGKVSKKLISAVPIPA